MGAARFNGATPESPAMRTNEFGVEPVQLRGRSIAQERVEFKAGEAQNAPKSSQVVP